jgi:hypothetical protein
MSGRRPAEDELTWILGSSRSGSTWLLRMLAEHPRVTPLNETGIGHHLGVWRPIALAWATSDDPPALTTFGEIKRSNPDYLFSDRHGADADRLLRDFLLDRLALQQDDARPHVVIKEPGGSTVADWLLRLVPGSRLVFLLRDGRDVVESWVDAYQPGAWATEEDAYPLADHGRLAFVRWQATVWRYRTEVCRRAYEAHPPDRRALVRYEDLLEDPERELARVHAAVGLPASAQAVRTAVEAHSYRRVDDAERGPGRHIRFAQPGRWRECLTAEEQQAMEAIMGDVLRAEGYAA